MIRTFHIEAGACRVEERPGGDGLSGDAVWIDMLEPTPEEEQAVERLTGIDILTREEMAEIEESSRLYATGDAAVMTAPLMIKSSAAYPEATDVTFVLMPRCLVTVRYAEPTPFATFAASLQRSPGTCVNATQVFAALMDAIVDRIADVLEDAGRDLDSLGRVIFTDTASSRDFKRQLRRLGRNGEIMSKARESLVGLARLLAFAETTEMVHADRESEQKLETVSRDVDVLLEHTASQANKTTFLLDALLGMINIEQSALIKMFSVVAVTFLPPMLVASIYGMNFRYMPELGWPFGYPLAVAVMVMSMLLPFLFFKRKGWI